MEEVGHGHVGASLSLQSKGDEASRQQLLNHPAEQGWRAFPEGKEHDCHDLHLEMCALGHSVPLARVGAGNAHQDLVVGVRPVHPLPDRSPDG